MKTDEYNYFFSVGTTVSYIVNKKWDKPIQQLKDESLSGTQVRTYLSHAESWHTCICSCLDPKIKRLYNGKPVDTILQELGVKFANYWGMCDEHHQSHKYFGSALERLVKRIDFRCAQMLSENHKDGFIDVSVEIDSSLNRYYSVVKGKYCYTRKSTGVIELVDPNMKFYADWNDSKDKANELIAKYYDQFELGDKVRDVLEIQERSRGIPVHRGGQKGSYDWNKLTMLNFRR